MLSDLCKRPTAEMASRKIIIDTDPGVDDVLAMLLALSAAPEELQVLLISLTFGNAEVQNVLRNTVAMFHVLELERKWRLENLKNPGFASLEKCKPIVAVGAKGPLEDAKKMTDYFHGIDGLGGVHEKAPHLTPTEGWRHLFDADAPLNDPVESLHIYPMPQNFTPSKLPAHKEILRILQENEPDTITIVALGPLTNLALAAEEDAETFVRAKEVVVMGGAIDVEGNVTPVAEFNHYACAWSAARVYALTSPNPSSVLPPSRLLKPYPTPISRRLNLTLLPLDVTTMHLLSQSDFSAFVGPLEKAGSPLAHWCSVIVGAAFRKMEEIHTEIVGHLPSVPLQSTKEMKSGRRIQDIEFSLHDPMCIWYLLTQPHNPSDPTPWKFHEDRDIRVEVLGQWTRGMNVVDRRTRKSVGIDEELILGDLDIWLHKGHGNRIRQAIQSPGEKMIAEDLLRRIFAC